MTKKRKPIPTKMTVLIPVMVERYAHHVKWWHTDQEGPNTHTTQPQPSNGESRMT